MDPNTQFRLAQQLEQQGDLQAAEKILNDILHTYPHEANSLHLLGLLKHQQGEHLAAITLLERSIEYAPSFITGYLNLGFILFATHHHNKAIDVYNRILLIDPHHIDALIRLGNIYTHLHAYEKAYEYYSQVLRIEPTNLITLNAQGLLLHKLKQLDASRTCFDQALSIQPDFFDALNNRGCVLVEMGLLEAAITDYQAALAIQPQQLVTMNNIGNARLALKQFEQSIAAFDATLAIDPDNPDALCNKGVALIELKKYVDALTVFNHLLLKNPNYTAALTNRSNIYLELEQYENALEGYNQVLQHEVRNDVLYNKGLALLKLTRYEEALTIFDGVLSTEPAHIHALTNRGYVLMELRCYEEACVNFSQTHIINPQDDFNNWNSSLCHLTMGDFDNGWRAYESRLSFFQQSVVNDTLHSPRWEKQPLTGKTILLHAEQGLGDTLHFVRYTEKIIELGGNPLLLVQPLLKSFLQTTYGNHVFEPGDTLPPYDYHCPLMSLPLLFNTQLDSIPNKIPYLFAESRLIQQWKHKLTAIPSPRLGIVWSSSIHRPHLKKRNIDLQKLISALPDNVSIISLQKEINDADNERLNKHPRILRFEQDIHDFSDTAALLANLDMVISIDTAVAHLAGSMGKPIWILLPFSTDWRWLLNRDDSPWYPTARLFRQQQINEWEEALKAISQQLPRYLKTLGLH